MSRDEDHSGGAGGPRREARGPALPPREEAEEEKRSEKGPEQDRPAKRALPDRRRHLGPSPKRPAAKNEKTTP